MTEEQVVRWSLQEPNSLFELLFKLLRVSQVQCLHANVRRSPYCTWLACEYDNFDAWYSLKLREDLVTDVSHATCHDDFLVLVTIQMSESGCHVCGLCN
jgi:hypothetical protein